MPTVLTYLRSCTSDPADYAHHQLALDVWLAEHPDHELVGAWVDAPCLRATPLSRRLAFNALLAQIADQPVDLVLVPASCTVTTAREDEGWMLGGLHTRGVAVLNTDQRPEQATTQRQLRQSVLDALDTYARSQRSRSAADARSRRAARTPQTI